MKRGVRDLLLAVLLACLVQAPFWIVQWNVAIQRPVFNEDLLLALILAAWKRRLGLVAIVVAWLVEIVREVSRSYNFVGMGDFLGTFRFAELVGLRYALSWKLAAAAAGLAACLWIVGRGIAFSRSRPRLAAALVLSACACGAADSVNGSNGVLGAGSDRFRLDVNIAGSPAWNSIGEFIVARRASQQPMQRFPEPRSYLAVRDWKQAHPDGSVLLVLVESMGLPRSQAVRDWLYARAEAPAVLQRWSVERSSELFFGPTTYGELRVLCGLRGYYTRLKPADQSACLPRLFAAAGQRAIGLHGFTLHMFEREDWWPALGIAPYAFGPDDRAPGKTGCNDAFPGVCDGVVLRHAVELADDPGQLVYVVTLDTHLPLPWTTPPPPPALQARCDADHVPSVACRMVGRLGGVLDELARDLAGTRNPPLVVVAGDHVPPFVQREDRDAFDPASVTRIVLRPRAAP